MLIAAAARPTVSAFEIKAVENAYFPWVGALHSLLDSLIDLAEDAQSGQRSLLDYYSSPRETAERMTWIATRAICLARCLPRADEHMLVLTSMTSFYLSAPEVSALPISREILTAFGHLAAPTALLFDARRAVDRVTRRESQIFE